ncbi:META domain-containing protein [Psychromarinibacter sp. S121]|uniref:META domain-containing protein n=1 Tax=Psychromarinibacter sp. S121 TaxID=3415127 RepID=UPI003C79F1B1
MNRNLTRLTALFAAIALPASAAEWRIQSVNGLPATGDAQIGFTVAGEIVGNTGCNGFQGSGRFEDDKLVIDRPMAVTRMFCDGDAINAQENAIEALLTGEILVSFDPFTDAVVLSKGENVMTLVLADNGPEEQAAPETAPPADN